MITGQPLNVMKLTGGVAPPQLPRGVDDPVDAGNTPLDAFAVRIAWANVHVDADGAPVSVTTIVAWTEAPKSRHGDTNPTRSAAVSGDNNGNDDTATERVRKSPPPSPSRVTVRGSLEHENCAGRNRSPNALFQGENGRLLHTVAQSESKLSVPLPGRFPKSENG